jgi:hypothetical protein
MRVPPKIRLCAVGAAVALGISGAMGQTAATPAPPTPQAAAAADQALGIKALNMPTADVPVAYAWREYRSSIRLEGGEGPYRVTVDGDLPPGISWEPGANVVTFSGVPQTAGTFNAQITLVDNLAAVTTRTYSFAVQPRPLGIPGCGCVVVTDAESITTTDTDNVFFPAVIGVPEAMHIMDGWMNLDSLEVMDAEAMHITDSITILLAADNVVAEAMHITDTIGIVTEVGVSPVTAPGGTYNLSYSQSFTAVGNTGAATLTPAGTLPTGMAFTTSGATTTLHGTPTQTGIFSFSITVRDTVHTNVVSYSLAISTATQTIAIGALPSPIYGGPAFTLTATASPSGLPVTITSTSSLVSGTNPFTPLVAGTATFQATQAGNSSYSTATPVNFSVSIAPATLTVTGTSQSRAFDQPNPPLTYGITGFVNGDPASIVTGAPTLNLLASPLTTAGYASILTGTGTLAAPNYIFNASNGLLTITPAPQTITFLPLPVLTHTTTFPLTARASSGLAVTYTVTGPASITNSVLTVTGSGPVTVTASQAGNTDYAVATAVVRSFTAQ